MSKQRDEVLLTLGYGIVIYAMIIGLFVQGSDLLPECKIYHETQGKCEVWVEKTPGKSIIQGQWKP